MAIRSLTRRGRVAVAAAAGLTLVLAGCGDDSGGDAGSGGGGGDAAASSEPLPSVEADDALAALVPADVAEDGALTVGSDTTYAPNEFVAEDGETIVGFDVDLFTLVAQKLGLEAQFQTAPFDSIIAGVGSGRYEVGVSSFTINPERLQQANMVSYYSAGTQWATKAGNPEGVDPDNACGLTIAVQKATVQVEDITARSEACEAAGEEPITINQYDGQDQATAAVVSGAAVAGLADSPIMAYAVQQTNGQLELLGDIYDSAPYGYVVPQDQAEFAQALADAVRALIEDGTYTEVLERWGVEDGAIDDPTVNPTVG
ncbi:ABC transporter substrate-binding protein [Geodermatophilus sabuli]|uniref:Polar amino acid transport system substrate-binding protein n=1 Tax=Geodermatophilus sabuli TaxID=1564158 RepID=A0A285E8G8_9ACTN|nr:ABC transporter substrate-binding protein [Geodermatophilus sabuli]MBB3085278.1 polar amino acid transport system substrate-binding protein [Geodermatophilus sabuli]SNX95315.1 polar amino acid transport system substrate-binding protein [Geodermatophilus sabuli]